MIYYAHSKRIYNTETVIKKTGKMEYTFFCPGCKTTHQFDKTWRFDKNMERPTVTPSYLACGDGRYINWDKKYEELKYDKTPWRCHSYITAGNIRFLDDCTHKLKGKTVPLEAF